MSTDMGQVNMAKETKPLIQIDDEVREMTDEEFAAYKEQQANTSAPLGN
jgi:hypothetical protein